MSLADISALVAFALLAVVAVFAAWHAVDDWRLSRRGDAVAVLREVVVHTRKPDDQTLRGLVDPAVLERRDPWLVLTAPKYADVNDDTGQMTWVVTEGDVTLPRDGIAFVQLLS